MQTYLCSRCNQKVRRSDLVTHRQQCGPGGDLTLQEGLGGKLGKGVRSIFFLGLTVLLAGVSLFLGRTSFQSLADMRQLERVPRSTLRAALEGEINVLGRIRTTKNVLRAPKTNTVCVYYRYMVEKEERDSDGDTTWRTIEDKKRFVPFLLEDSTGTLPVIPSDAVDFSVRKSWSTTQGDYRYTEWRLEAGEEVFAFGYAVSGPDGYQIQFDREGHYTPLVSEFGETRERTGMAGWSIGACWLGLVLLAAALSMLISMLRIHRLLVYFSLLNLLVTVYLVILGLQMMKLDLQAAVDRLTRQEEVTRAEFMRTLSAVGVTWQGDWSSLSSTDLPGLSADTRARLRELRLNLSRATDRVRHQRSTFPENLLAPLWRIPSFDPFPLPEDLQQQKASEEARFETARVPPLIGWVLIGTGLAGGAAAFHFGFRRVKFKRCMENLPTVPTTGVTYGLTEVKGVVDLAESADVLKGPLSHQPCVQYHYVVKEKRGSGKKSSWVTIVNENRRIPFLCRDGEGRLLVDPTGSEVFTSHRSSRRMGRRQYSETRLELGDPLYAIGECVLDPADGERLYLRKPEDAFPFLLGNRSEHQIMLKVARRGILLLNVSFAAILLVALLLFGLSGSFAATDYLASALMAPLFMTAVTLLLHYNDLVFLRERVRRNHANIDVALQKRHDLVPRLEAVTGALQDHERDLQERLVELRNGYRSAATPLEDQLDAGHQAVDRLIASAEAYPDLISQPQTGLFMRTLITLENEIALMRNGYNDAVETYNTRIQSVPDVFFARLFQFREMPLLFGDSEVIRIPPNIQELWEKEQLPPPAAEPADPKEPEAEPAPPPPVPTPAQLAAAAGKPAEPAGDAPLPDFGKLQDLLFRSSQNPLQTLDALEQEYEGLRRLSPGLYRTLRSKLRTLMESDQRISLTEFAVLASLQRHLDPAFGLEPERPVRHRNFDLLKEPVSLLLSLIAHTEETPDTAEMAFQTGVANLNDPDKAEYALQEVNPDSLAGLEEAVEDIAHATPMIRANVLYACEAAVKLNGDATQEQVLLLRAVADVLKRPRPDGF